MFYQTLPKAPTLCSRLSKTFAHTSGPQRSVSAASFLDRFRSFSSRPTASMDKKWWGRSTVAVVTGANKGIGYEIARLLAEAGMTVVVTSRSGQQEAELSAPHQQCPIRSARSAQRNNRPAVSNE
eukprot:GHUV01038015.1.p1 GENE.GHUV01038015.1~~GHUV01038015.1.p1  ORF type:complete len:125 (+),score=1.85 GHUV01038015.1:420-794(+)